VNLNEFEITILAAKKSDPRRTSVPKSYSPICPKIWRRRRPDVFSTADFSV